MTTQAYIADPARPGKFIQLDEGRSAEIAVMSAILVELRVLNTLSAQAFGVIDDLNQLRLDAQSDPQSFYQA